MAAVRSVAGTVPQHDVLRPLAGLREAPRPPFFIARCRVRPVAATLAPGNPSTRLRMLRSGHRPNRAARPRLAGLLLLLAALGGCGQRDGELPGAGSEPAGAVRLLADHLHHNDLVAFARDALPPEEHARLAEAWARGHSRWPVTEVPVDERVAPRRAHRPAGDAVPGLPRQFDQQFAGQDSALRDASRALVLFGRQYIQEQGDYSAEERSHYTQLVSALGQWAAQAPLGDRRRAYAAIDRLHAAARATGLASEEDLSQAGMVQSLARLGPLLAEAKAVTASYGLDLDRSLAELRVGLVEENGDRAVVRVQYPLAGAEIDTTIALQRRHGHWYMSDYLEHAASVLAQAPAAEPAGAAPEPPEEPAGPAGGVPGR